MRKRIASFKPVMAAEDEVMDPFDMQDPDSLNDTMEDVSDTLDDIQDAIDDEDDGPHDTVFDVKNNIENHYIAECQRCHDIFISAVVESDSPVTSIEGECPCCHYETKQELKWIVRDLSYGNE